MIGEVRIERSVEPSSLRLTVDPPGGRVPDDVALMFMSGGAGRVRREEGALVIPEDILTRHLAGLRGLRAIHGRFVVTTDEYVGGLIERFADERSGLLAAREHTDVVTDPAELLRTLRSAGFGRAGTLTTEQVRDVARLTALPNGANFSVPGAGKTTSLLAVHAYERERIPGLKLLVVAPRNALISWDEEVGVCLGPDAVVARLTGGQVRIRAALSEDPSICAITYQQLPLVLEDVKGYLRRNPVHLVLDESHRMKSGAAGVQGSAVIDLAPLACRRDILSGTPMPQQVSDVISQFDFLWPNHEVCRPLGRSGVESERVAIANATLRPLFTRTTKAELGLKDPRIEYVPVELGAQQAELYELLRSEAARVARGLHSRDRAALRAMGAQVVRLLQVASNPKLLLRSFDDLASDSATEDIAFLLRANVAEGSTAAKVAVLEGLASRILREPTEKVVIWSTFISNIESLERSMEPYGAVAIHGAIPTGDDEDLAYREARIRKFNEDPECRVLVANPAACGEGISLHRACHNAIYLDRTFNAAHYLQSVDRIHRLGLAPDVDTNVFVLVARGTVDEAVRDRVGEKVRALGALLDDEQLASLAYDPEDAIDEVPAGLDSGDMDVLLAHLLG